VEVKINSIESASAFITHIVDFIFDPPFSSQKYCITDEWPYLTAKATSVPDNTW
jgi:hypothetical protein